MSNIRRKITINQSNLDPLSYWYTSKIKYGDAFGNKITNPIETDNRLIVTDRALSVPHVIWSLGGRDENNQENEATLEQLREFVTATLADDIDRFLEFTQGNNQYIFTEKGIGSIQESYYSMPANMLQAVLQTALYGLQEVSRPGTRANQALSQFSVRNVNGNRVVDRTFGLFIDTLRQAQFSFGGDRFGDWFTGIYADLDAVVRNGGLQQLSISDVVSVLEVQILAFGETTNIKKLAQYFIFSEIMKIVPEDVIEQSILSNNTYDYLHSFVETETPYVNTKESFEYLEGLSTRQPYKSEIEADYFYYAEKYEEAIDQEEIPELLLPNLYARNLFTKLFYKKQVAPLTEGESRSYDLLRETLGLSGQISEYDIGNLQSSLYRYDTYYDAYALSAKNIDYNSPTIESILGTNSSIIFNASSVGNSGLFSSGFIPMEIGVEFTRDEMGEALSLITQNVIQTNRDRDITGIIFENIKQSDSRYLRPNLYSTQVLRNFRGQIEEKESSYAPVQLKEFPVDYLFQSVPFESLLISDNPSVPSRFYFNRSANYISQVGNAASRRAYANIVSGQSTKSEAIGYKINKVGSLDPNNNVSQDVYISNGSGERVVKYRDSQIKYGKEYNYSLDEYRLVYATKYKFRVISRNLPFWLMENYLGLNNNAEEKLLEIQRGQVIDPFNPQPQVEIPNIMFEAYVEEESEVRVKEIPVYDKSFNDIVLSNTLNLSTRNNLISGPVGGDGAISYPTAKVLDRPPPAPLLEVYPMFGIKDQIKIAVSPETGEFVGTRNSREIVTIGDMPDKLRELKEYQDTYVNRFLPPNKLEYKSEGLDEVRNIILYRTNNIDLNVENYNDLYKSFNPGTNPSVLVRKYTDKQIEDNERQEDDLIQVQSYQLRDDILPNTDYYYTCVTEDVHGNPSPPSVIYKVKLFFNKGLLIPEVSGVTPTGLNTKNPSKEMSKYLQIDASNIQTFPYLDQTNENLSSDRSLGSSLGKSIEEQPYIIRLTSKDTGRKFDIKLNFVVRVDGDPINEGT